MHLGPERMIPLAHRMINPGIVEGDSLVDFSDERMRQMADKDSSAFVNGEADLKGVRNCRA
jgi:hypothetical protein